MTMRGIRFTRLGLMTAFALARATGARAEQLGERSGRNDGSHAAPLNWTGLHVGAAVGYGLGTATTSVDGENEVDVSLRGALGILSVGYDLQLTPRMAVGIFWRLRVREN